jgi:type I thyroxine 5'-deiodinase
VLSNLRDQVLFSQAKTEGDRAEAAEACVLGLHFRMPMVLDRLSNEVDQAYSALPERLYVIDRAGTIAWRSGPGPFGFDVDGWKRAVEDQASSS